MIYPWHVFCMIAGMGNDVCCLHALLHSHHPSHLGRRLVSASEMSLLLMQVVVPSVPSNPLPMLSSLAKKGARGMRRRRPGGV
jgi:hypothetical protein